MNKLSKSMALLALVFTAGLAQAWPTKVQLITKPDWISDGVYVVLRTDKGSVTSSEQDGNLYQAAMGRDVGKGTCFILETEMEAHVRFNVGPDKSQAHSAQRVPCK